MAPTQSVLSKFLYDGRLQSSKSHASNSVLQVRSLSDDSLGVVADGGSGVDPVLAGTTSVTHGV